MTHPTSEPRPDKHALCYKLIEAICLAGNHAFLPASVLIPLNEMVDALQSSGPSREEVATALAEALNAMREPCTPTDRADARISLARALALYRPAGERREVVDVDARADAIDGVVLAIANALGVASIGEELGAEDADGAVWSQSARAKLIFQARDLIAPLTIEHAKWVIEFGEADRARQLGVTEIVRQLLAEEISERKAVEMLTAAAPAGETK